MGITQSKFRKSKSKKPLDEIEVKRKRQKQNKVRGQKKRINPVPSEIIPSTSQNFPPEQVTKERYEELVNEQIKSQLKNNFSTFLLNQLLLSTQFYLNFERDKLDARQKCRDLEETFNGKLLKYSILLPNVLDHALSEHIHFQQKHGPTKNLRIKLHTQSMYVIFENLEISKHQETSYDILKPKCKIFIDTKNIQNIEERRKMSQGYVRLKFGEAKRKRISVRNINPVTVGCLQPVTNDSKENLPNEVNENQETINESEIPMDTRNSIVSSTDSPETPSYSIYDYSYITNLNTHQPLTQLTYNNNLSSYSDWGILPDECISNVVISQKTMPNEMNNVDNKSDIDDYSDSDSNWESATDGFESDTEETEVLEVRYLNSKAFFKYFSNLFHKQLLTDFGIKEEEWNSATFKGASIYTQTYEIIPALYYPQWPECAYSWRFRDRKTHDNPFTGEKMQWPTDEMIKTVQSFGCHAIPIGYAPKKGHNLTRDLEWKIVFPEAERYLESSLSSTQVKVYMICKALIKTFIEPEQKDDIAMFSIDHLRAHLFWSIEQNYGSWPPEFLGEALLRFLHSFLIRLSNKYLPDYFIPERNLIENIPEYSIVTLHQIIFQVVQNPVMHIMMAYRNLKCDESQFYPTLNYKALYFHIVIEDPRMATYYKCGNKISSEELSVKHEDAVAPIDSINDENEEPEGLMGFHQKNRKRNRRRTMKLKRQEKLKMQKKLEEEKARRGSENSIDLQFTIKNELSQITELRSTPEESRRALITEIFAKNFVTMAKAAYKFESYDQCKIYLKQAARLCDQLNDYQRDESARKLLDKVNKLKNNLKSANTLTRNKGPTLPLRINLEPVGSLRRQNRWDSASEMDKNNSNGPITPTKAVQFKEESKSIEPRFFTDADIHSTSQQATIPAAKEVTKINGILKPSMESTNVQQINSSILKRHGSSKSQKKSGAISILDEILVVDDNDSVTEF